MQSGSGAVSRSLREAGSSTEHLISKEAGFCTYLSARAASSVGSEMLGEGVDTGPPPRED